MYMGKMDSIKPAEPHETFLLLCLGMVIDKPLQFILATLVLVLILQARFC